MKTFVHCAVAGLLLVGTATAQERARITVEPLPGPTPWTSLDVNDDPNRFQFANVTDRTGGHRPGVFEDGWQLEKGL